MEFELVHGLCWYKVSTKACVNNDAKRKRNVPITETTVLEPMRCTVQWGVSLKWSLPDGSDVEACAIKRHIQISF